MYIFIINPIAGNGRAKKIHLELMEDPDYQVLEAVHYYTEYSGHEEIIAQQIKPKMNGKHVKAIIIIGGDGTMHNVLNGLIYRHIPIAFIPGGSGNDFARGLELIKQPKEALRAIVKNTKTTNYWQGLYETNHIGKRYFVNCIGFGFDAVVAASANKSRYKKLFNKLFLGPVIYLFTLLKELIFFKPISITVELDGVKKTFSQCFLLSVNNHPFFGGGMKINPLAKNQENDYSIIIIDSIPKWKVFFLFSTVFTGMHLRFKEVSTYQAQEITITAEQPIPYQVDGEASSTTVCTIRKPSNQIKVHGAFMKKL